MTDGSQLSCSGAANPGQCRILLSIPGCLPESWGSQSWLQPAFSRHFRGANARRRPAKPPEKPSAGKIVRPQQMQNFGPGEEDAALANPGHSRLSAACSHARMLAPGRSRLSGCSLTIATHTAKLRAVSTPFWSAPSCRAKPAKSRQQPGLAAPLALESAH